MKDDYLELGHIIYMNRIENKLSRRELARKVGISDTELRRIEEGERQSPNLASLIKICEILKLNFLEILIDTGYLDPDYLNNSLKKYEVSVQKNGKKKFIVEAITGYEAMDLVHNYIKENDDDLDELYEYESKEIEDEIDKILSDSYDNINEVQCPFYKKCVFK